MIIDRRVYNDSVISKAAYWLSKEYVVSRKLLDNDTEEVTAVSVDGSAVDEQNWNVTLSRLLQDYKLRAIIAEEAREVKTILYAKAFADDEDFSEEDIKD